jgi:hypothetical protein
LTLCCLLIGATANYGQVASNIDRHFADFENLEPKNLFKIHEHGEGHEEETADGVTDGEITGTTPLLDKEESHAAAFLETAPEDYMVIVLPRESGDDITLWLYRTTIWGEGSKIIFHDENNGDYEEEPEPSRHYWGIVAAHPDDSLAMCSL